MFVEYRKPIVCSKREKGKDENTVICRFSRRRFPPFNRLSFWFLPVYSRMSANRFWQDSSSDSSSDYSYSITQGKNFNFFQYLTLWRSTSMVTDFGSPEVDKNGNISVYRLLFFLMMVSIDRSRRALSIDILIAKN